MIHVEINNNSNINNNINNNNNNNNNANRNNGSHEQGRNGLLERPWKLEGATSQSKDDHR